MSCARACMCPYSCARAHASMCMDSLKQIQDWDFSCFIDVYFCMLHLLIFVAQRYANALCSQVACAIEVLSCRLHRFCLSK